MIATKRMSTLAGFSPRAQALGADIQQFKEESEKEQVDEVRVFPVLCLLSFPFLHPSPPSLHPLPPRTLSLCLFQSQSQSQSGMIMDGNLGHGGEEGPGKG